MTRHKAFAAIGATLLLFAGSLALMSVHPAGAILAGSGGVMTLGCYLPEIFSLIPVQRPRSMPWTLQRGELGSGTSSRLDANETAFFERELEFVKAKSYDVKYAELKATRLIPISTAAGPGAEQITYYTYDQAGVARIIAAYADDLPRADIKGTRNTSYVYGIGTSYGYSIQEIRNAIMAGLPLEQRKANAARRANDQLVNTIGFSGLAAQGLYGLFNTPNVNRGTATNDGTGSTTTWSTKTPDQILRDMNQVANTSFQLTLGVESPNVMLLPIAQYTLVSSTPFNSENASNVTILDMFLRNSPFFKDGAGRVEWVNEAKNAAVTTPNTDIVCCYRMDEDHLTYEIPQPFEQFPPEPKGLNWEIACHSRNGGVIVYYPLSISILEGI